METIDIRDLERWLVSRKRELGITGNNFIPRNDGTRRTQSKRELLKAIADSAAEQGRQPPFPAKF